MRLAACLVLVVLVALAGCRRSETTLDRIRRTRVLPIGTDATYPPFESVRAGRFEGFDIDLGNAVAGELGARAEWINTSFDGVFPALLADKFDLVMSSVTITDERRKQLAFSEPYYTAGQIVAVRADAGGGAIEGLDQLAGRTAGIQINTTAAEVLKDRPAIRVRKFPSIDLALQDLENGNLDAVVGDAPTIRYFIARGFTSLRTAGDMLTEEHYGIVMRPQDRELRKAVDTALARLQADGRFAALESKWFGPEAVAASPAADGADVMAPLLRALAAGLWLTVRLTAIALLLGMPLGLAIALARLSRFAPGAWLSGAYIEVLRGTPLLVQIIFIYYALPKLVGVNLSPPAAAVLALTLNSAAYIAEIFRSGIQSIDAGQMEAARSLGMTYGLAMRCVVLPQAFRRVLPPLTNESIALLKDSSLVSVIGMAELTRTGQELASQLAQPLLVWPAVAFFYLAVTFPLTRLAAALERRWSIKR